MTTARTKPCPLCGKPPPAPPAPAGTADDTAPYLPFCSQGCRDRDLLRWLSEGYAIPAGPAGEADASRLDGLDSTEDHD